MTVFYRKTAGCIMYIVLLCLPAVPCGAQQKSAVTLQAIIDAARSHLPVLAQKKALISSAEAQAKFVRNSFLPSAVLADEVFVNSKKTQPKSYRSVGIIPS